MKVGQQIGAAWRTPASPEMTGVTVPPVTVTVAVPVQVKPASGDEAIIWPVIVIVSTPLGSLSAERGLIVMMAS